MRPTIILRSKDRRYDSTQYPFFRVVLERETNVAWFGAPVDNPACLALEWPKIAWEKVTSPSYLRAVREGDAEG